MAARRLQSEPLEERRLLTATPELLAELNAGRDDASPTQLFSVSGTHLFFANDGAHGHELWRTDGTEAGTQLVKDIQPGPGSSVWDFGFRAQAVGETLYFWANDGVHGVELWKSDGTEVGTTLVRDLVPGTGSGGDKYAALTEFNGQLLFLARNASSGTELWTTDGTFAGTQPLYEIGAGASSGFANITDDPQFTVFDGELYFAAQFGQLWKTNGTSAGTSLVKDFDYLGDEFQVFDSHLYFYAEASASVGRELWRTDGTSVGTELVKDIMPGAADSEIAQFEVVGDTLFFSVDGDELWKSDGTEVGTVFLKRLQASGSGDRLTQLTNFNGTLVFAGRTTTNGWELWKSDGTSAGTVLVKDIRPGSGDAGITQLTISHGSIYFLANDGTNGQELWKSDGTEMGTSLFHEVVAGPGTSKHASLLDVGGLVFTTLDFNGVQLWYTDGTPESTTALGPGQQVVDRILIESGTIYFRGGTRFQGTELWRSDLTDAGTQRVKDINTGSTEASNPGGFTEFGGFTYFVANSGSEIWRTDGSGAGTELVIDLYDHQAGGANSLLAYNGALYFSANDPVHGEELWKSDGTSAGTELFLDLRPGAAHASPRGLQVHDGRLVFAATDGSLDTSREFWVTDGTVGGTQKLFTGRADYNSPPPVSVGGVLFFVSEEALYASDGTPSGTELVRAFANIGNLANVNGTLYFTANDGIHGVELWKSDGTLAGTQLVADVRTGISSTNFTTLVELNGRLYFGVLQGSNRYELWSSDGTAAGTQLYYALELDSSTASGLVRASDSLFFYADSDAFGLEMFVTDGTAAGTRVVRDIRPGGSEVGAPFVVNQTIYFVANDGSGKQFWTSDGSASGTVRIGPAPPPFMAGRVTDVGGTAYFGVEEPWVLRTPSVSVDLDGSNPRFGYDVYWSGAPAPIASPTATLFSAGTTVQLMTVRIVSPQPGDVLAADTTGTAIVASFDSAVLTLSGEDSAENYSLVLRSITFQGISGLLQTKLEVQARNSQGLLAVPAVTTVFYSVAPQIDLNGQPDGGDISVVWQGSPINVSSATAHIADPDSAQLSQLVLVLLQPEAGDQLIADTTGTGITATFDGATLTLSGLDTVANHQQVLQSVRYSFSGASPTHGSKQIEVTATDSTGLAGLPVTSTVTFALRVDLNGPWGETGTSVSWSGSPTAIALPTASILAAGGVTIGSMKIEIVNAEADDLLTATTAGTNIVASFSGGVLSLSGVDSRTNYEQVLRSVKYQAVTPLAASKVIRVRVTDEFGSLSNQATAAVKIHWDPFIEPVRDILPGAGSSNAGQYVGVGETAYFTAFSEGLGVELWKSDGTEAGTVLVKDIRPGAENSAIQQATQFGGLIGFIANDGSGAGLWRSDGTEAGTYSLKPGDIHSLVNVGEELFFVTGDELWKSDGTVAGTSLVKDFDLTVPFEARRLTAVGNLLFFGLDDGVHGTELWKSDGTEAGTVMVKDIGPGAQDGLYPGIFNLGSLELVNVGGVLYFVAHDGENSKLWQTDGTEVGTTIVAESGGGPLEFHNYSALTNLNGSLLMVALSTFDGIEIFNLAGVAANVNQEEGHDSNPWNLTVAGNSLFFTAIASTDDPNRQLWSHTPGSASELIYDGIPDAMLGVGDTLFFIAAGTLWRSDGTTAGTERVIQSGAPMLVSELGRVGDTLYFTADAGKGVEPYLLRLPTAETAVAGRHLLYEGSKFAGPAANPSGGKDAAIATDKVAYLPGQGLADTSSVSSYSRGINGIVVDVFNAAGTLTVDDFQFNVGVGNSPGSWANAPAPSAIVVRAGQGAGNSDRVEITWADGAIKNTWLQVIVRGNDAVGGFNTNTGLAASDVFYFGNRVGDTFVGATALATVTGAFDEISARSNPGVGVPVTNLYDFNRDGVVGAADQLIARNNGGVLPMIDVEDLIEILASEPAESLAGDSANGDESLAAIAFALAAYGEDAESEELEFIGRSSRRR